MAKLNELINKMKMIIKTTLTVNGYKATLKPKLQLYQEDIVFIEFALINSVINSVNCVLNTPRMLYQCNGGNQGIERKTSTNVECLLFGCTNN